MPVTKNAADAAVNVESSEKPYSNDDSVTNESSHEEVSNRPSYKSDPQKLFELVLQNYDAWLQVINKQFQEQSKDQQYLPFPKNQDFDLNKQKPIFNYSLLDALEQASSDFSDRIHKLEESEGIPEIPNLHQDSKKNQAQGLLKESEINFLRSRLTEIVMKSRQGMPPPKKEGFSLYDTQDEEGLHEGNTGDLYFNEDGNQDDYDLEEIENEDYQYDYSPTIEVELNTAPECEKHGQEICDCPIDEQRSRFNSTNDEGPSCEFTFEYDRNGELVPTYSNVEEKLRLMSLNSRSLGKSGNMKLPSIKELNIHTNTEENSSNEKKNKKKNKKKKKQKHYEANESVIKEKQQSDCCLFCEYEALFGTKPRQMIKWYNEKVRKDEERRQEFKRKLENAKLKALKRQRELRQRQMEENGLARTDSYDEHYYSNDEQYHAAQNAKHSPDENTYDDYEEGINEDGVYCQHHQLSHPWEYKCPSCSEHGHCSDMCSSDPVPPEYTND